MYPQSYSPAQQVDFSLMLVFVFSAIVLVGLTLVTCWFIWRYHHKRNPEPTDIRGNMTAEVLWTVIPFFMVMGLFYYGWTGFKALRTVPRDAMEVQVTARMFSWTFVYPNGKQSSYLAVPVGKPVKLDLRSVDVIHSFYAPAFRIKMDTVPGMNTYAWFKADRAGTYDVYCAEYCGAKHSKMMTTIQAMDPDAFVAWVGASAPKGGPEAGRKLMEDHGCFSCHAVGDEQNDMGPSLQGLYGNQATVISGKTEKTITVDDAYLKESITDPGKVLVKGYDDTMPPYTDFSDEQIEHMLEYLRSIAAKPGHADTDGGGHDHSEKTPKP